MLDYDEFEDDSIRLYTPVFQRVIILAAVIIAVPVVMWTITTFVRSYVGRPKVPALEHVASTNAAVAPPTPAPPAAQSASLRTDMAAAGDPPNAPADIKKPAANLAALPDSPPAPPVVNTQPAAPLPAPAAAAPSPATLAPTPAASPGDTAPTASLPNSLPNALPRPAAARSTDNTAASSSDRGLAWPNPNPSSPPDFAASRLPPPPQSPPPARVAALETVAADEPGVGRIVGQVPLPRHRPGGIAMTSSAMTSSAMTSTAMTSASTTSSAMTSSGARLGAVPLPHARPSGAPAEATTSFETPTTGRTELENAH